MRATDFEYRYKTALHLLVVGTAFLTYAFQPDDIVWALIKHHTIYRALLERVVFGGGAILVLCSAALQTWADAYRRTTGTAGFGCHSPARYEQHPAYAGRLLFALGIGLLAPALGTAVLLCGEFFLVARLFGRDLENGDLEKNSVGNSVGESREPLPGPVLSFYSELTAPAFVPNWRGSFRRETSKWGLAVTMIVFAITLQDRLAEVLATASLLLWAGLNVEDFIHPDVR